MTEPADPPTQPKPPRQRRPDYDRIRRFLAKGGVLQREVIESADLRPPDADHPEPWPSYRYVVWFAAARDGRSFDADTCEWFRMLPTFVLDHSEGWLEENPPGIFKRVPDIHPTLGEAADQANRAPAHQP